MDESDFKYLLVDGVRIRYVDKNTNASGHPVIFIHGLGGSIESWDSNIRQLISSKLRIIALDLPGFGFSDKSKIRYSIKFYANFITTFLEAIGVGRKVTLVGSSLGGQIAAEIAINKSEIVSKLVLISPAGATPKSFKGTPSLRKYVRITRAKSSKEIKKILSSLDNTKVEDSYANAIYRILSTPEAQAAFVSALNESSRAPRFTKYIANTNLAVLLIWGKEDKIIPVKYAIPFFNIPNCRLLIIERCGHRPHVEKPELFNRVVYDFVCERIQK
jgi:2-hydroxy-6-oxonona-2,4-dienedioate hydrolase